MKKTAKEILERLEEYFSKKDEDGDTINEDESISSFAYGFDDDDIVKLGLGLIEETVQKGGEGEGDEWYVIHYFKDHDVYIKTEGYYASYEGVTFDEGYGCEVKPKQKTITTYEEV